jgi:hypothetical protein
MTSKAALSIADQVKKQLEDIVENATKCLQLLDEDRPDIANFREPLKAIATDGDDALGIIAQIRK